MHGIQLVVAMVAVNDLNLGRFRDLLSQIIEIGESG
jgi:hypothetical protein